MRWLIGIAVVMLIAHVLFRRAERTDARRLETQRAGSTPSRVPQQGGKPEA